MTEHLLKMPDRRPVFEHVGGAGVAEGMRRDILLDPGKTGAVFDAPPYAKGVHLMTEIVYNQIPFIFSGNQGRPDKEDVVFDQLTDLLTHRHYPVFIPLAMPDKDKACIKVGRTKRR